jgi:hypothetical protein
MSANILLCDTVRPEAVTPFHLEKLAEIDRTDFSGVVRKTRFDLAAMDIHPTEEQLAEGLLGLKQYYAIAVLDPMNMHAVSDGVDPYWHSHILHTQQYADFCQRVVGGFMHHVPLDHAREADVAAVGRLYAYTIACLNRFFWRVNEDHFPSVLPDARLICFHGARYENPLRDHALMPFNPEMWVEELLAAA